eukprot:Em0012g122a
MAEEENMDTSGDPVSAGTTTVVERVVRMSLRPPPRFGAKGDWKLWLSRFEMYATQAKIAKDSWSKELLSLLEDEPYRMVTHHGLAQTGDYDAVCDCIQRSYAPLGSELEWQLKVSTRVQKVGESLMEFCGALRGMADKAFPAWPAEQLQDLLRNQFIQGVLSSSVQLALMKEEPKTLDDALKLACKHEMVETAQKHLQMLRQKEVVASTEGESSNSELVTATLRRDRERSEVETLRREVQRLSEKLKGGQRGRVDNSEEREKTGPVCWNCKSRGHVRKDCPKNAHGRRQLKCWECGELGHAQRDCLKRRGVVQAVSSSMMIQGEVAGRLTRMLIDTGSGVTLIREDVWRDVLKGGGYGYHLKDLNHPVVTANGQQLNLLGQVELPLHIGSIHTNFPVLVASQLTQECLIGADFLSKFNCQLDLGAGVLVAGTEALSMETDRKSRSPVGVCDVQLIEHVEVPGSSQMRILAACNGGLCGVNGSVLLEPNVAFMERHGLMVARSVSFVSKGSKEVLVQLLNPSSFPIVLHKPEVVGTLHSLDEHNSMACSAGVDTQGSHNTSVQSIAKQLVDKVAEGVMDNEKDELQQLLLKYSGILSHGYWQVEVAPEDREKTAFVTPYCLFQFRVMPFGLTNAPATFQRLMERVLAGLHWTTCLIYLDDILIFSATVQQHFTRLREIFDRLKQAGLKIKPIKLTEKGHVWHWSSDCDAAFLQLKERLVTSPILGYPVFNQPFMVDIDASGEGLGAALSQYISGVERVIAFASRSLSKAERKYCATRRVLQCGQTMLPYGGCRVSMNQRVKWLDGCNAFLNMILRWFIALVLSIPTLMPCPVCLALSVSYHFRRKPPPAKLRAPLQLDPAVRPLQRVAMDIMGPLPETSRGNKYILVIADYFTKGSEAYPIPNMEAITVAKCLVNEFICRFGVPEQLHSDQGRNFEISTEQVLQEGIEYVDYLKKRFLLVHQYVRQNAQKGMQRQKTGHDQKENTRCVFRKGDHASPHGEQEPSEEEEKGTPSEEQESRGEEINKKPQESMADLQDEQYIYVETRRPEPGPAVEEHVPPPPLIAPAPRQPPQPPAEPELPQPGEQLRRSTRNRHPPHWYGHIVVHSAHTHTNCVDTVSLDGELCNDGNSCTQEQHY